MRVNIAVRYVIGFSPQQTSFLLLLIIFHSVSWLLWWSFWRCPIFCTFSDDLLYNFWGLSGKFLVNQWRSYTFTLLFWPSYRCKGSYIVSHLFLLFPQGIFSSFLETISDIQSINLVCSLICVVKMFYMEYKNGICLYLLRMVSFVGSFMISVILPFVIHSRMLVSWTHFISCSDNLSWIDMHSFKPESMPAIIDWCFPIWYFLSVVLRGLHCMFTSGPSSNPCNFFFIFFIHSTFIFCSFRSNILCQNCFVSFASN